MGEGSEGERETARRILQDFKERHPGVESAARTQTQTAPPDPFGRSTNQRPAGPQGPVGNWENIFRYVHGKKGGQLYLMLRIPFDTLNKSRALNFLQKERFRAEVHAILDRALDALLEG